MTGKGKVFDDEPHARLHAAYAISWEGEPR